MRAAIRHLADGFVNSLNTGRIDRLLGTELARPFQFLIGQIDGDHAGANRGSHLDDVHADAAAAENHDLVARLHLRAIDHRMIRCGHRISDDAAFNQGNVLGHREEMLGRRQDVLGVSAVNVIAEHDHALAHVLSPSAAHRTMPAAVHRGQQDRIPFLPILDAVAQGGDGT